jgi:hypothetical protein
LTLSIPLKQASIAHTRGTSKTLGALRDRLLDLQYQDQQVLNIRKPLPLVLQVTTGGHISLGVARLIKACPTELLDRHRCSTGVACWTMDGAPEVVAGTVSAQ